MFVLLRRHMPDIYVRRGQVNLSCQMLSKAGLGFYFVIGVDSHRLGLNGRQRHFV